MRGGKVTQEPGDVPALNALADVEDAEVVREEVVAPQPAALTHQPAAAASVGEMFGTPAAGRAEPVSAEMDEDDGDAEADVPTGPGRGRRKPAAGAGKRGSAAGKSAGKLDLSNYVVAPTVSPAALQPRHFGVIMLFVMLVVLPTAVYSWYLWNRAADQYVSDVGFASRTEDAPATFDFLGALGGASSTSSKDMDILNQFIVSQDLVARIDKKLNLRAMYSKPTNDPLGTFDPKGTIEDLVDYWRRMVVVNYDSSTGLMNLQVFAFDRLDAQAIALAVLAESTATINDLNVTAQEDTTKYSKEALQVAEDRLSKARVAVTAFRVKNHIVDPSNDLASQMSVLSTLVQQQAAAQIDLDLLAGVATEADPRVAQLNRRIEVIKKRILEEKAKVGAVSDSSSTGYAVMVSDYERLKVDEDFAEKAYLASLAAYDQALTDAQHKTHYLAAFVTPTLAEASTAPNRPLTAALTALIGFLAWAVSVLIYYALRDRR